MKILGSILFAVILASVSFSVLADCNESEEILVSGIMRNDEISKEEKSKQLATLYNFVSDDYTKSLIISEMSRLPTKTSFMFLIDKYPNASDDQIYGVFSEALQAHYEFFNKDLLDPDLVLLNAAIEQIHDVYEVEASNYDQSSSVLKNPLHLP